MYQPRWRVSSLNATIVQGRDKGCDKCGGVNCGRFYLSCKSGDQCVYKDDICNAMEMNQCVRFWSCNGWSRIWRWHLSSTLLYSKCPAAYVPTNHLCEMLIISDSDALNPKYDCLSRVRLYMGRQPRSQPSVHIIQIFDKTESFGEM